MTRTVRQLMDEQAAGLVGREDEKAVLRRLQDEGGPRVVFVHGIAGIGKTALIESFAVEARAWGTTVLRLDCRWMEPTERGFLAALEERTGGQLATPEDAANRLGGLGDQVVLVLDTYELYRILDPWLRQVFVPALPGNVRVIISGREAPMTGWPSSLGALFRGLPLGNLGHPDADALLVASGIAPADADRIYRIARGHPLSLRLAASALAERPGVSLEAVTVKTIVEELTELYLGVLDDRTRQALDAASVVRRATLSLLGAMLPESAPQDAFDRLTALPFVDLGDDGLVLHDTVREAIAAQLLATDPDRSRRYRAAAWRQLRDEVTRAPGHEMWRYTADLLYILQNPAVREAFFPTTEHLYSVEVARPEDHVAIAAIAARHEPDASRAVLELWWRLMPGAFRVARDRGGSVAGFSLYLEMDEISHRLVQEDPVVGQCWEHLRAHPVPRGQRNLFSRLMIALESGESSSAVQAALWLDLKRRYMELRPNLRRLYTVARHRSTWEPMVNSPLGFERLPGDPPELDGIPYYPLILDFGPSSVDGWLSKLVAGELRIEEDSILDLVQHQLVLDGRRVDLTKLEFEVISYLYQRRGAVVERSELLRDVWGYDDDGGSNVIEANVRSLRHKLGDRATSIETVRGLGYRFAAPA
ncbi:MAG: winged helix-turn-helix domain-containing protein [Chloroflexota bacterium]